MEDVEHKEKNEDIELINPKVVKQLKDTVDIFTILRDISSDPLKKAMEERIQRSIIENIDNFIISKEKAKSHEDIAIYEKISPGDVYILRIVSNGLEVIENHNGEAIYKRVTLSL